jgi:hypothetical protein
MTPRADGRWTQEPHTADQHSTVKITEGFVRLKYEVDAARGLVTITGDYAGPEEWRALLSSVAADPDFRPGLNFVRDLRTSEQPVDAKTVLGIMAVVREFWDHLGVRKAVMVTGLRVDFPAMMAAALAQEPMLPCRAFSSYDDAMAWLAEP